MAKNFLLQHNFGFDINKKVDAEDDGSDWLKLGSGIKGMEIDNNEESEEFYYYDGGGNAESAVTGQQKSFEFECDRDYNDLAQNYIFNTLAHTIGPERDVAIRVTYPDGTKLVGPGTVTDIKEPSGEANKRGECGFTLKFAGKPKITAGRAVGV